VIQIARLYRPLSATVSEYEEDYDDDEDSGTSLLPTHNADPSLSNLANHKKSRLADVWDEREEVFDIGGESDDEDRPEVGASNPKPQAQGPRIVVTHS